MTVEVRLRDALVVTQLTVELTNTYTTQITLSVKQQKHNSREKKQNSEHKAMVVRDIE